VVAVVGVVVEGVVAARGAAAVEGAAAKRVTGGTDTRVV